MRLFDFSKILPSLRREKLVAYDAVFLFFLSGFLGITFVNFNLHWLVFLLTAALCCLFFVFKKEMIRKAIVVSTIPLVVFSGYASIRQADHRAHFSVGERISTTGVIDDFIHDSLSYGSIKVKTDEGSLNCLIDDGEYHIGDKVRVQGIVSYTRGSTAYLNKQKVVLIGHTENRIILFAESIREKLFENVNESLPVDEAALANGLLLGDTYGFSKEFKDNLKKTGTSHIVALSGWNVMILMTVSLSVFGLAFGRRPGLVFSIILIFILWLLAGYSASLSRAIIMGAVFIVAALFGRRYSLRNALVLAAFLMNISNPEVSGDLGFQLSFAAIIGLAAFSKDISNFVDKISIGRVLNKLGFSETVSAQLVVMPVILLNGIRFSLIGIIANMAIIPFIPITFLFVFLTALTGAGCDFLSWQVSFIANCLLNYEIKIIGYFSYIF